MHAPTGNISSLQQFHMIHVGAKKPTHRWAAAIGEICVGEKAFTLIRDRLLPKGDALTIAEIAGVMGAKKTPELIPLCHPLALDHVQIIHRLCPETSSIQVLCCAAAYAKTGVEMEAMMGANAALLTIYDLTKMVEPDLVLRDVRLLVKLGGKSGLYLSPQGVPAWVLDLVPQTPKPNLAGLTFSVLTVSDRASRGKYSDESGPLIQKNLAEAGATLTGSALVPDEKDDIRNALANLYTHYHPHVILTTGGTGVGPRDVTPEALAEFCTRLVPGIGELLRHNGARFTTFSWGSRSIAGMHDETLIIALPGSPKAVSEGLESLAPLLPHLIAMAQGKNHDPI